MFYVCVYTHIGMCFTKLSHFPLTGTLFRVPSFSLAQNIWTVDWSGCRVFSEPELNWTLWKAMKKSWLNSLCSFICWWMGNEKSSTSVCPLYFFRVGHEKLFFANLPLYTCTYLWNTDKMETGVAQQLNAGCIYIQYMMYVISAMFKKQWNEKLKHVLQSLFSAVPLLCVSETLSRSACVMTGGSALAVTLADALQKVAVNIVRHRPTFVFSLI